MYLDFQKPITDFKYLLCFDLAKYETGVSLINIEDIHAPRIENVYQISIDKKCQSPFGKFHEVLDGFFNTLININGINVQDVLIVREKQPTGFNVTTTISTLQALAGIHAILDLCVYKYGYYEYQDGIHSSSVKACFRHLLNIDKPQKEDIKAYLLQKYNELSAKNISLDISDSIALCECLLLEKWNNDLKDVIKEEKKHLKALKMENAKIKQQKIIDQYELKKII